MGYDNFVQLVEESKLEKAKSTVLPYETDISVRLKDDIKIMKNINHEPKLDRALRFT